MLGPVGPSGPQGERGERGVPGERGSVSKITPWSDQIVYSGELVTHRGATWQAIKDTAKEPSESNKDWQLIAAAGASGASFVVRGTYDPKAAYRQLDIAVLDHTWFIAKRDDPGTCPGPGWQSGPVGKRGEKGIPGERGVQGAPGKTAPHWVGVKLDGFNVVAVMSDGTIGPRFSLASMFEQFEAELRSR
jgi:hypothetical protein